MRYIGSTFLLLAGSFLAPAAAEPWSLTPCGVEHQRQWQAFAEAMKQASPGSSVYVPNPFPKTDQQVIDNFLYQHGEIWGDTPLEQRRPEEQRLFSMVDSGQVRFQVLRVENWTPLRCGPKGQRTFYFIVRVLDGRSGAEISRAALNNDGLLARLRHKPLDRDLSAIMGLEEAARSVISRNRIQGRDFQYVTTWGSLECDLLSPCVSFRSAGRSYLAKGKDLYLLRPDEESFSLRRDLTPHRKAAIVQQLRERGKSLVSVGGDAFGVAVRVEP